MTTEQDTVSENENKEKGSFASRALRVLAYPIAAISGFWAADVSVHNSAYNTAKNLGFFKKIMEKTDPVAQQIKADLDNKLISPAECFARSLKNKADFQNLANERLREMSLDTFRNKWQYMSKSSRQDAVLVGMTVAGIAIGALLTIAESKTLSTMFAGHSKKDTAR